MKYSVEIIETVITVYEIEADNESKAYAIAEKQHVETELSQRTSDIVDR